MSLKQIEIRINKLTPRPLTVLVEDSDGKETELTVEQYLSGDDGVLYKQVRGAVLHDLDRILRKLAPDCIIPPKGGVARAEC